MVKGKFITIYGINNIGKTTQAKLLVRHLIEEGYDAVYIKYPIYELAPTGPKINEILRTDASQQVSEEDLQTLFMQNRRDYEPTLRQLLDEGRIVVAEDYTGTGIAWGTAKGLDLAFMEDLNRNLLREDFAVLLTGKRDIRAVERKHIHESNEELIRKVDEILRESGQKYGWHQIELYPKIEDTAEAIWQEVIGFIKGTAA